MTPTSIWFQFFSKELENNEWFSNSEILKNQKPPDGLFGQKRKKKTTQHNEGWMDFLNQGTNHSSSSSSSRVCACWSSTEEANFGPDLDKVQCLERERELACFWVPMHRPHYRLQASKQQSNSRVCLWKKKLANLLKRKERVWQILDHYMYVLVQIYMGTTRFIVSKVRD